jgi:Zn-dependent membrane protease YugP
MYSPGLLIIFIVFLALSAFVSWQLKRRFKKYSTIPSAGNKSGREVAEAMLSSNGIRNVSVICGEGSLTDHYNPSNKTISLSPDVYNGRNVSAAAVAAHECGHAVQDARSYAFLSLRSALVPLQNISSTVLNAIFIGMFIGAFLLPSIFPINLALQIIIICYGVFTLFAFITLPVEIDASHRALVWLNSNGVTSTDTHGYAKDALKWASYTYVVAALSSLVTLLYYIMIYMGRRN